MTPTTHRRLAAAGLVTALAVATLSGCAQEEPTHDELTSTAPTDAAPTTSEADDEAVTSTAPDDAGPTTGEAEATTEQPPEPLALTSSDDSFELEVPATWEDALDLLDEEGVLVAAKDTERVDDFYTNVVVTSEDSVDDLSASVEAAATELAGEDGDYELLEPVDVDGQDAPGYTLVRDVKDTQVHQTQRWINHDGTLYVVTLSAVSGQAEDAGAILQDILASWTWTD